jgi:hypothetical protein
LGKLRKILSLTPFRRDNHELRAFQGSGNLFLAVSCQASVALNAGVMQRCERVVALPDPKSIEFPQPQQHFLQIQYVQSGETIAPPLRRRLPSGSPQETSKSDGAADFQDKVRRPC